TAASTAGFAAQPGAGRLAAAKSIDMASVPAAISTGLDQSRALPYLTNMTPAQQRAAKGAAKTNPAAGRVANAAALAAGPRRVAVETPGTQAAFAGQSSSAATCPYFGGCEPSDMALAANASYVFQGVNTSF